MPIISLNSSFYMPLFKALVSYKLENFCSKTLSVCLHTSSCSSIVDLIKSWAYISKVPIVGFQGVR